jgi:hypothetical protein
MYCNAAKCNLFVRVKASLLLVILTLFIALTAAGQNSTPKATAETFYRYDQTHSQVFTRISIEARKKWFSPDLYRLFLYELKRETAYLKKNPTDKPNFGDGLPFQPLQENCGTGGGGSGRKLSVKQDFQKGDRSVVVATFAYPKPCEDPEPITYTIGLIRGKAGWQIDDINYGEDTTLKQRLNRKEY